MLNLPAMRISTSGSEVTVEIRPRASTLNNDLHSTKDKKTSSAGKNVSGLKTTFQTAKSTVGTERSLSVENSSVGQKSNRLVAREIQIERLDSGACVTSYKDSAPSEAGKTNSVAKTTAKAAGIPSKETKTRNVSTEQTSKEKKEQPEFCKVKLRKTKAEQSGDSSKPTSPRDQAKIKSSDMDDKRVSRTISSERFERLMFDFQRGVPTETIDRRASETDHIALQQKARELAKSPANDDLPVIARKKKEPSIFTEGLKVSDFVKQVNKMNPETDGPPKWKVQRAQSQTSSTASSDVGGDHFYQGIPGEDAGNMSDENDDIYEKVTNKGKFAVC